MGIPLKDIVSKKEISLEELRGKKIAFDASNVLYQFLSAIRGQDGRQLTNSEGKVTSHLIGLFSRTAKLIELGIKPVFVFDGKPPELKFETTQKRRAVKERATELHKQAKKDGDSEAMRRYAMQTTRLTPEMVSEAKELLRALGIPTVQALGEGEAQAAHMAKKGDVWAVASQDYDALLFGTPRLVRNLTISQRRRVAGTRSTIVVKPEIVNLIDTLTTLKIDLAGLIDAATLIGTDYNEGIKGIGPKTAIKIIQEKRLEEYHNKVPRHKEVRNLFLKTKVITSYPLSWKKIDEAKLRELLINKNKFSETRVSKTLKNIQKSRDSNKQSGLKEFL
tara:strand:+ start:2051 stop:3055 length:1005 start_codon:yes stop_codon:yes gene_type:complete